MARREMAVKVFPAVLIAVVMILLMAASEARAQVEFSSSLNPVGSGARATGMGGAFIAVADDATAASWNPAGLVQLEKPEFSVVLSGSSREQSYISETHPELNTANRMSTEGLNFASLVYPFLFCDPGKTSCRNAVFSLSFQRLYDTDKTVRTVYNYPPLAPGDNLPLNIDFEQTGYLHALSPALALQVTPSLYAGAAMNIWNSALDKNGWEQTTRIFGSGTFGGGPFSYDATESKKVEFEGFNMNFGFLWNVTSSFTVGGVYKTPFEASLKTTTQTTDNLAGTSTSLMKDQKLRMPQSYGIGSQYKFSQNMLIAFDAYRTQWSRFVRRDPPDPSDPSKVTPTEVNAVTGQPIASSQLKDTMQLRFGGEYLIISGQRVVPIRVGLFLDPEPAVGRVDRYRGFSLGTGYSAQKYSIDASYQRRTGRNVTSDIASLSDSRMNVTQQTIMMSVIYYY